VVHNDLSTANRFALGGADGTPHCVVGEAIAAALTQGGANGDWARDIRREVWAKLLTNVWSAPLGCSTGATTRDVVADPALRRLCLLLIAEVQALVAGCGITLPFQPDGLLASRMPAHRTSMLQDLLRNRPVEYDAVLGALHHLARIKGVAMPMLDAVLALLRGRLGRLSTAS
jgi:2-dehydropantoate 2-reductase